MSEDEIKKGLIRGRDPSQFYSKKFSQSFVLHADTGSTFKHLYEIQYLVLKSYISDFCPTFRPGFFHRFVFSAKMKKKN